MIAAAGHKDPSADDAFRGWVMRSGSRSSGNYLTNWSMTLTLLPEASNAAPPSIDSRPPSKAPITFFDLMARRVNGNGVSLGWRMCPARAGRRFYVSNESLLHIISLSYIRQSPCTRTAGFRASPQSARTFRPAVC